MLYIDLCINPLYIHFMGGDIVKITWYGHSCFQLKFNKINIIIDPFITGNPNAPIKADNIRNIDLILLTHGHEDHVGDTKKIAIATGANIVASYDLANRLAEEAGIKTIGINIGGTYIYKDLRIIQVHSFHVTPEGTATGYILRQNKISLYHPGDTGLFNDMEIFSKIYKINIAMLPIGGYYTMGIPEAVEAVKLIKPKIAIPMHYNTFPVIEADPYVFKRIVEEETDASVLVFKPGESKEIEIVD